MSSKSPPEQFVNSLDLLSRLPIMAHAIDNKGILIGVSDFWLKMLGYEREEVIGHRSTEFLTEKSRFLAEDTALPEYFSKGYIENLKFPKKISCCHPHKCSHERIYHGFAWGRAKYRKIIVQCRLCYQPSDI